MKLPAKANVFLPWLRKSRRTGPRGALFRWLDRIGPVTRSSPLRRAVQTICLVAFVHAFFYVCWPYSEHFSESTFRDKESFPADLFLLIDPLVGLSTALAGKVLNWATLVWMIGILAFCILIPRAFCGWFCPLGTLIDAFDWLISRGPVGRRLKRFHLPDNGPKGGWVHLKYYLLAGVLLSSAFGVLTSGFVAAIPVLTRGFLFTGGRWQLGLLKGENHVATVGWTFWFSVVLFAGVFALSLLGRRFWCRYVCPSGALLSVFNFLRVGERKVESSCINCNKCVEICPFDAIYEDFTTRTNDCTYCQTCGGECPVDAIKFVTRWNGIELKVAGEPEVEPRPVSRRGFLAAGVLGGTVAALTEFTDGQARGSKSSSKPLRPPGSVPESAFLDLCIRCGECFKVCPGPVLHPAGLEYGIESLWTPVAHPEHAGRQQDCNFCKQLCPTGAIQLLDLPIKRDTHMGLAKVNTQTCLPFREDGREDCNLCFLECEQAGYHAIEMKPISLPVDREELEMQGFSDFEIDEMSTIDAPFVDADKCVGCGICTYRCHTRFVVQEGRLDAAAIPVFAENEDRMLHFPQR